jgi:hypothetical protein
MGKRKAVPCKPVFYRGKKAKPAPYMGKAAKRRKAKPVKNKANLGICRKVPVRCKGKACQGKLYYNWKAKLAKRKAKPAIYRKVAKHRKANRKI